MHYEIFRSTGARRPFDEKSSRPRLGVSPPLNRIYKVIWLIKYAKRVSFPNLFLHRHSSMYDLNSSSLVPWFLSMFYGVSVDSGHWIHKILRVVDRAVSKSTLTQGVICQCRSLYQGVCILLDNRDEGGQVTLRSRNQKVPPSMPPSTQCPST